jgi:hypothetical protein
MSTTLTIDGASTYLTDIIQGDLYLHNGNTTIGAPIDSLQSKVERGQPDGYASLDSTGKVPVSQIPSLVIHDVFIVNNYVDLATLTTAQVGDVGIVTSDAQPQLRGTYILTQEPSSLLANWYRVSSSTLVASVNGIQGPTVVLSASNLTTGTLPVAQLPVLQATGDATGVSLTGTGSIPLTLTTTGVTPGIYTRPLLNIDAKGRVLSALDAPNILYQQPSSIDPSNNIIYRIGNADESSYLDMSGGCDIMTPGNKINIRCAQFNLDCLGSTVRLTTDDAFTLESRNLQITTQDTTNVNSPNTNITTSQFNLTTDANAIIILPQVAINSDANTITSGATVFAGGGAVVMEGLGEFVNSTFNVVVTTSGILNKKRYAVGTVTSGAAGVWTFTHNIGQVPSHYTASSLNNSSVITGQNIVSINAVTTTTITGRVMQPITIVMGGNPMQFVTGAPVRVYCEML